MLMNGQEIRNKHLFSMQEKDGCNDGLLILLLLFVFRPLHTNNSIFAWFLTLHLPTHLKYQITLSKARSRLYNLK